MRRRYLQTYKHPRALQPPVLRRSVRLQVLFRARDDAMTGIMRADSANGKSCLMPGNSTRAGKRTNSADCRGSDMTIARMHKFHRCKHVCASRHRSPIVECTNDGTNVVSAVLTIFRIKTEVDSLPTAARCVRERRCPAQPWIRHFDSYCG